MSDRIDSQKASITKLLIKFPQSNGPYSAGSAGPKATTNGILASLAGLRTLHLRLHDGARGRPVEAAGPFYVESETATWQLDSKVSEASECFTNFKLLPLKEVIVLLMENPPLPNYFTMEEWRRTEQIKCAEAIRDTILDDAGPQRFRQEEADAKAAKANELAELQLASAPCIRVSTMDGCAELNKEEIDKFRLLKGKPKSSKRQAWACKHEHICLVCLSTLKRTQDDTRQGQKPGECDEGYSSMLIRNNDVGLKSILVSVGSEETVGTILARHVSISGLTRFRSYNLQLNSTELNPEATVGEIGLTKDSEVEIVSQFNFRAFLEASIQTTQTELRERAHDNTARSQN